MTRANLITYFSILVLLISCSEKDSVPLAPQINDDFTISKRINNEMNNFEIFGRQFAVSLNDQEIVSFLKKEFNSASGVEKIMRLNDLLHKEINYVAFIDKLSSDSISSKYHLNRILSKEEIEELIGSYERGIDIYFPVEQHRRDWKNNVDKMIIALPPLKIDESDCKEIRGYKLNGKEILLDAKIAPFEPVLIISPCEHVSHTNNDYFTPVKAYSMQSGQWRLTIYHFRLMDDHEPWYKGNAEIYVKVCDSGHWYRTDCYSIDEEKTYYNYNKPINPVWASQPLGQRYFEVWEDDSSDPDDLVEKYWHWPSQTDPKTRYVDLWLTYWYYGDNNDADVYMGMQFYDN